jgi:hypothetical protein
MAMALWLSSLPPAAAAACRLGSPMMLRASRFTASMRLDRGVAAASFAVNADGSVKSSGQAKSTGGEVHGSLYGGVNGTSFVAMAE